MPSPLHVQAPNVTVTISHRLPFFSSPVPSPLAVSIVLKSESIVTSSTLAPTRQRGYFNVNTTTMIDKQQSHSVPIPPTVTLTPSPDDAVSCVAFNPSSTHVLVSTWSGTLTLHTASTGTLHAEAPRHPAPFLDAAWYSTTSTTTPTSATSLLAASLDGTVLAATVAEAAITPWRTIGRHPTAAARVVVPNVATPSPTILSAGWDSKVNLWDMRQPPPTTAKSDPTSNNSKSTSAAAATLDAGGKVYGAAACGANAAIIITSHRRVRVIDFRKPSSFLHDRQPPTLSYQLRGISAAPDGTHYAVGSTEGRVAVEWLPNTSINAASPTKPSFSFRCHRVDGLAFPVNDIAHNARYASFATAGADGHVAFWDGEARKRIAQYSRYPTSIASIDFDHQSNRLAVAVSYTFEEGEKDHPADEVHIRTVDDSHIATKRSKEQRQSDAKA